MWGWVGGEVGERGVGGPEQRQVRGQKQKWRMMEKKAGQAYVRVSWGSDA